MTHTCKNCNSLFEEWQHSYYCASCGGEGINEYAGDRFSDKCIDCEGHGEIEINVTDFCSEECIDQYQEINFPNMKKE